jgi:hypothetical protein
MKLNFLIIVSVLSFKCVFAQPNKGEFINVNIGIGLVSSLYVNVPSQGDGFFAESEYVVGVTTWLGIRPYVGYISTSNSDEEDYFNENFPKSEVSLNAIFTGTKIRLVLPIPYIAPFVEGGVGVSFGNYTSVNQFDNISKKGAQVHLPFSLGLAIGKRHNFELAFKYFVHPNVNLLSGAATIGFSIPLNEKTK